MPALMRVRFESSGWAGAPGLNTFYFVSGGVDATQEDADDVSARVRAFFGQIAVSNNWMPAGWSGFVQPEVDVINPVNGTLSDGLTAVDSTALTSGSSVGPAANNAMCLLRFSTAGVLDGKRIQGRANIGPTAANQVTAGKPSATIRDGITVAADAHLDVDGGSGSLHVVWHRPVRTGGVLTRDGAVAIVTGYATRDTFATLRSRNE